ncbi:MAG TPA: dienelactone hydrolase family protein [Usitatibacter sp.]|nr:dienelactone hydrolase family protein [Usitatibacter sp.]
MRRAALAACAGLLAPVSIAFGADTAFRVEVHPVPTLTLSVAQVLAGSASDSTRVTIAGELRLPFATQARVPAVILLHGDAGAISNQVAWTEELNAIGIAVFNLDSFSGRGAVSTTADLGSMPDSVGSTARVVDAYRALAVLARHPRIDPARIAVMGFSSGGRTVMVAAQSRFARAYGAPGPGFAAYVALYPSCNVRFLEDTRVEPGPQRVFIGAADVTTSASTCAAYVDRLRAAGADATIVAYAGAHHGFDNVAARTLNRVPQAANTSKCNLVEKTRGELVNAETGRPFDMGDACVGKGLIAGYNAAADAATKSAVKSLLRERFGLRQAAD